QAGDADHADGAAGRARAGAGHRLPDAPRGPGSVRRASRRHGGVRAGDVLHAADRRGVRPLRCPRHAEEAGVTLMTVADVDLPPPDLEGILADLRELIECESPSSDLAAVAQSADLVARIGTTRLGVAPERIVVDGCTHLRWSF